VLPRAGPPDSVPVPVPVVHAGRVLRVLVTVMPFTGHVGPVRAVVAELVARGHRVRVHTGSRFAAPFTALGAQVLPWTAAPDFDEDDLTATFPVLAGLRGPRQLLGNLEHVFLRTGAGQLADLRAAWAQEPWDVVLGESTSTGAPLAAEATGTPWASLSLVPLSLPSRDLPPPGLGLRPWPGPVGRARDAALGAVTSLASRGLQRAWQETRAAAGLPGQAGPVMETWLSPHLVMATGAPAVEHRRSDLPPQVHFVGRLQAPPPASAGGGPGLPPWWPDVEAAGVPVVHVTQGTYNTDPDDLLRPALEALAGEDVLVVAATGSAARPDLPFAVPANARVTGLLPYAELLPSAAAVVTNGGWGGVLASLAAGVPLVVAGKDLDKPEVARRVAASGAGVDLRSGRPRPAAVRRGVLEVLHEPRYREAAARVAAQLAARGGQAEVVDLLERLVATGRPVLRAAPDPWA